MTFVTWIVGLIRTRRCGAELNREQWSNCLSGQIVVITLIHFVKYHVITYNGVMAKTKLTLNIEEALIEEIKIQAIRRKTSVSKITEELYREFLQRKATNKQ